MSSTDIPKSSQVSEAIEVADKPIIVPAEVAIKPKKVSIGPLNPATGKHMTAKEMAQAVIASEDKESLAKEYMAYIIANTPEGAVLQSSRLSNIRKILKELNAAESTIDLFKAPAITSDANLKNSNKSTTRLVQRIQAETNGETVDEDEVDGDESITIPEYFSLNNVYKRLMAYDTTLHPTIGSVVDVMILWSARPAEIMTLSVDSQGMATGYAKGENAPRLTITFLPLAQAKKYLDWIQSYKETLPLPTKDGKKYREFLRPFDNLKLKTLRSIGAEYAAYTNTANPEYTNDKELMALRRIALRHLPQVSSAEFYSVIVHTIPREYRLPQSSQ